MVCLNVRKIFDATEYHFCNLITQILFFWWPRLPTVSNQMHQYCHLSAKLSYLMLMTFDPCNDGLLVIFPGSEILEGIGSPARAYIWGCTSLRCSKAILPTPWLSILHPHFQIKISVRQTRATKFGEVIVLYIRGHWLSSVRSLTPFKVLTWSTWWTVESNLSKFGEKFTGSLDPDSVVFHCAGFVRLQKSEELTRQIHSM